jgi:DNA-binding transcriptional ArsR family regulator
MTMQIDTTIDLEKASLFETLGEDVVFQMAESFKALSDPTRLQILALLFVGERSVGDLADHLEVSQSAVSHQLRILRTMDIVRYHKEGREVYYSLADDHVRDILLRTLEHILDE